MACSVALARLKSVGETDIEIVDIEIK